MSSSPLVPSKGNSEREFNTTMALRAYTLFMAFLTFLLVIAGGLVTSTGSALAVPDWPLSFGRFFPPMVGGVLYEHGHRMIAATIGLLTIILAVWLWRSAAIPVLRRAGWTAVGLVCLQGILGGVTVLLKLPAVTSVAHACLGQIFFSWMVCIAVFANKGLFSGPSDPKLFRLAAMTSGFILLQLLAGAIFRHTGKGLHWHFLGAFIVTVHVILLARRVYNNYATQPLLNQPATALMALVGVQLVLGWFAWRNPGVAISVAHVANGALILASSLVLTVQAAPRLAAV